MSRRSGSQSGGPTRTQADLADVVELLLDKGVVINADIAVSIGDTELLGIQLRAAIASFETAAKYGLEFPTGTDMDRLEEASGRRELEDVETVESSDGEDDEQRETDREAEQREADGGSPVAPLHRPPISEHAPWLKTPPISEDPDDTETEEKTYSTNRPMIEPGTATRPGRPRRSRTDTPRTSTSDESDVEGSEEPEGTDSEDDTGSDGSTDDAEPNGRTETADAGTTDVDTTELERDDEREEDDDDDD